MRLSPGKIRGMQKITNEQGLLTILAFDHRDPIKHEMAKARSGREPSFEDIVQIKRDFAEFVAADASGVILDQEYCLDSLISGKRIPRDVGIIMPREESGYQVKNEDLCRSTVLLDAWNGRSIKKSGGDCTKLLLPYHPEANNAQSQEEVVKQVASECHESEIPFLLELICYPIQAGEADFESEKPDLIVESVKRLAPLGVDIMKIEFPKEMSFCRKVSDVLDIPWTVLSAGMDFECYQKQVEIACEQGASGFAAGRAIWGEALTLIDLKKRERFLKDVARKRLSTLSQITRERASPWDKL